MPDSYTRIRFNLNREDWHGETAEILWAEPVGSKGSGVFRLMNSPYYARGVSYLDIVRAEEAPDGLGLDYAGTVEPSGHSTVWLQAPNTPEFARHWQKLHSMGCTYEGLNMSTVGGKRTLYSVDVPPEADLDEIVAILEEGDRNGAWLWQIPHEGQGSPSTPSGNA